MPYGQHMFRQPLSLLCAVLTAGGVDAFPAPGTWRLNEALRQLDHAAATTGTLTWWQRSTHQVVGRAAAVLTQQPDGAAISTDLAVQQMLGSGLLSAAGRGSAMKFSLTDSGQRHGRRLLFTLPPDEADLIYLAGRSAANRLSASSKNWDNSPWVPTSRSVSPRKRLQPVPGM